MKRVLVFGGTHGNEWTGIMAVTKETEALKVNYPELDLHLILANPEAFKINKRFKDEDLNRAFQFLNEDRKNSFEHGRAREIKSLINEAPCFLVDLHTTTSNMGPTIIVSHVNQMNLSVASELKKLIPSCKIILSPDPSRKYLASQSDFGLMIEVGPVANGLLNGKILNETLDVLKGILTILAKYTLPSQGSLEVFEEIEDIYYPVNEKGEISAYIHSSFQDLDFHSIKGSYTPFQSYNGEVLTLKTAEELYPIFINEAAYYPQKLAFTLCRKLNKSF